MAQRNSHCSWCGAAFAAEQTWPRHCAACGRTSYQNPLPVAVILVPVGDGLLLVRRNIPPRQGELALPGGFIGLGETWQEAGAREVWEETGLRLDPAEIRDFRTLSDPVGGFLLVFGLAHPRTAADLPPFAPNDETIECITVNSPQELAFPLHTAAMRAFFASPIESRESTGRP